jgi:hypothetical protein
MVYKKGIKLLWNHLKTFLSVIFLVSGSDGEKKSKKNHLKFWDWKVCSTYIYIHTRNAFWVPRRTSCDENVKITYIYIYIYIYMYMVLWCFWSPFFNILFYLWFFRHKKVTKTYVYIYITWVFFTKRFYLLDRTRRSMCHFSHS